MDLFAFIQVADLTKASVEKLFDEGGSTEQGDSAAKGGCDTDIELVMIVEDIDAGNVIVERPKRPRKKRPAVTDTSGSSYLPKKLKGDRGTSNGVAIAVSATPEREVNYPTDFVTGAILCTIGLAVRLVISSDYSHHSSTNAPEAEVDSIIKSTILPPVMNEAVITTSVASAPSVPIPGATATVTPQAQPSIFYDSSSACTVKPDVTGSSHLPGKELLMGSREVDSENLCEVLGYKRLKERIEEFQDAQMNVVNEKVAKLDADLLEMALHIEEKFYPHLLTTISGRRWLLTHGLKLVMIKCLNSQEYLLALGMAISRAIKKEMKDRLLAGIDQGREGGSLADIAAYYPAVEANYNSALQRLREVDFLLLAELNSHKDTSLSFALSVTHSRIERIRENVTTQWSTLADVWVSLIDPLSAKNLMGAAGTSDSVPTTAMTTTALSTTFAFASSIPLVSVDDYEIVGADAQEDTQGNVASFYAVNFEKEELGTTPERDPLS
nr:hypothetical protein [Tanacetum cinerariifolium]